MKQTRRKTLIVLAALAALLIAGCGQQKQPQAQEAELLISAAASLTDVMMELGEAYAQIAPEVRLTFTFGSSGALQSQIEEGAPADIFISAGQQQMDALADQSLLLADSRRDLLVNQVVLIVPKDSTLALTDFADVTDEAVKTIALGDPAGVPVGQYAQAVFTYLDIWEAVQAKAVLASDVRQVLTWVESQEADCGVVYATDAAISQRVQVASQAPEASHPAVIYPAAVMAESPSAEAAQAFLDFLAGEEAAAVFERYGFTLNQ